MPDFLLEIGTEEIPDWMIAAALADLRDQISRLRLAAFGGAMELAGRHTAPAGRSGDGLAEKAPDIEKVVLGPYLSAGPKSR